MSLCGSKALAAIIAVNLAVFAAVWAVILLSGDRSGGDALTHAWLCVPGNAAAALRHPTTCLTYMVTHYDILHLLFNMLWLFWFGQMLGPSSPVRRVLTAYIGGGVAGAVAYIGAIAAIPSLGTGSVYLTGASAAVLSVMTTAAILNPDRPVRLMLFGEVKLKWLTVACVALTLLGLGGGSPGAQSAHIGGVLFGSAYAIVILRSRLRTKRPAEPAPVRRGVHMDGHAVAKAAAGRLADHARLDELLDKIGTSGYNSLSARERLELDALSRRLGNNS